MSRSLATAIHSGLTRGDLRAVRAGLALLPRRGDASSKLDADGVIAIEESYDVSANVFSPVDQRKKAPPMIALEPRTLDLVRRHRRYVTQRSHRGLKTGLLFPFEAGTRPVGNDQLNDVWRECR